MLLWALVALGGALGAISRYAVDRAVNEVFGTVVLGTFVANISGSFLLGVLVAASGGRLGLSEEVRAVAAIGFLGSYTTFSTLTVASDIIHCSLRPRVIGCELAPTSRAASLPVFWQRLQVPWWAERYSSLLIGLSICIPG